MKPERNTPLPVGVLEMSGRYEKAPGYNPVYRGIVEGRLPADRRAGRYFVNSDELAAALSLKRAATPGNN